MVLAVASCSPPSSPATAPVVNPVAAPTTSGPAPVARREPQLGPFVPVVTTSPSGSPGDASLTVVRYGRGTLRLVSGARRPEQALDCGLRGGSAKDCAMFVVSAGEQTDEGWRIHPEPPDARISTPRQGRLDWDDFSPGRDALFAHSRFSVRGIERIDARGEVTTWLAPEQWKGAVSAPSVLEAGERRFVLWNDGDGRTLLAAAQEAGGQATLGPAAVMPMGLVPRYMPRAGEIQFASCPDGATRPRPVLVGMPAGVSLPGGSADEWALVWIELVASTRRCTTSGPWLHRDDSLPLSDRSSIKRIHLTVLRGTSVVSDAVLRSERALDPTRLLPVRAMAGGVEVMGVEYSRQGRAVRGRPVAAESLASAEPTELSGRSERPELVAFDAASGEGLLVVNTPRGERARTFNARGDFVGAPMELAEIESTQLEELTGQGHEEWLTALRQGSSWILSDNRGAELLVLPGGSKINVPEELRWPWLRRVGGWLRLVSPENNELRLASVDAAAGRVEMLPPRPFASLPGQIIGLEVLDPSAEEPTWLMLVREPSRAQTLWQLRPGAATWQPALLPSADRGPEMHLFDTWSGPVVETTLGDVRWLRWLRSEDEQRAQIEGALTIDASARLPWVRFGPLVTFGERGQWAVIPPQPGAPIVGPFDALVAEGCTRSVATSPTTVVLGCAEPIEAMKPGIHAGLRTFTLPR